LIEVREVLCGDVVLAPAFGEAEQVEGVLVGEGLDGLDEGVGDGGEQGGGGEEVPSVVAKEGDHAELTLEFGDEDVEVHAVDALDFQGDVLAEDSGDGLGYTHGGFWSQGAERPTDRSAVSTRVRPVRSPLVPSARTLFPLSESARFRPTSRRS